MMVIQAIFITTCLYSELKSTFNVSSNLESIRRQALGTTSFFLRLFIVVRNLRPVLKLATVQQNAFGYGP